MAVDVAEALLARLVREALAEDIGSGDLTTDLLISEGARARAAILAKEPGVICGVTVAECVFRTLDEAIWFEGLAADGDRVERGSTLIARVEGSARALLTGERTALNLLGRLSGVATLTRRYVDAVAGTKAVILDTRKTMPGLRLLEKEAVRCGGGTNHRIGLFDAILVKENHIAAAGSIEAAIRAARTLNRKVMVEVEVENLEQLQQALDGGVDRILLDNFSHDQMREAVRIARAHKHRAELEASGNMSIETLRTVAETGVDFISVGGLTKHVKAVDLSMRFA
jgi:nicotinate-nucleotide pyrophosphorylase (carboxylating)